MYIYISCIIYVTLTQVFLKSIEVYSWLMKILVHHLGDDYEMSFTIYPLCTVYQQETKQRKTK